MEREDPIANRLYLFGGDVAWNPEDWTASDDRVRGGSSISHLEVLPPNDVARFWGNLDIKTLGGAGFASQRTVGDDRTWNLEDYEGVEIVMVTTEKSEDKMYTFNIKNQLLPPDPDTGREQSTISYEFNFRAQHNKCSAAKMALFVPWKYFRASYRGREPRDAPKLDLKNIKRFGIMIRSFFGGQEGDFSLTLKSIAAAKVKSEFQEPDGFSAQTWDAEKGFRARPAPPEPGTAAAFAFERLSRWSVAKGEARYPHRRFPMVPSWYFEEYSRRQVAQLFNIKPPEFWNSLTFEKLREAAPLLKTEWTTDQEEIEPEHGKDLANYLTSIADSVIRDAAEHARQQKPQETQETAQSAEHSKRMSPLGRDLEKQEDILARSDVSSGDKKTPDGQTAPAARAAPSPYKVLYVVGALLLALWVLHPGNCK
ncbi:complex I intermediate-associated protein 30-domain-containing protein [Phyllosticta capitalensis]